MSTTNPDRLNWKEEWEIRELRWQLYVTAPAFAVTMFLFTRFILTIEARPGVLLPDPILELFPARDVTWIIFALIYGATILGIFSLVTHPRELVVGLRAYSLMVLIRMAMMYMVPLAPPGGMILLIDPFAGATVGATLSRDLFFSGHTATLCMLFLTARNPTVRLLFLICAVATGTLLLVQHVHYSIDVVVAPFITFACYRMASYRRTAVL